MGLSLKDAIGWFSMAKEAAGALAVLGSSGVTKIPNVVNDIETVVDDAMGAFTDAEKLIADAEGGKWGDLEGDGVAFLSKGKEVLQDIADDFPSTAKVLGGVIAFLPSAPSTDTITRVAKLTT